MVLTAASLQDFFRGLLVDAAENQKVELSDYALNYVTNLLVNFQETARLFAQKGVRIPVLADMLAEAMEADAARRIHMLKNLGDTSLMVSGFFPEALSRRSVDIVYYKKMGEIAYSNVGALGDEDNIFEELSERFQHLSFLINEVSEQTLERDYSVLKLLEYYSHTGSDQVLEKLKRQNIIPLHNPKDRIIL